MTAEIVRHLTLQELQAGLHPIRQSPQDAGRLDAIVIRPAQGQRDIVQRAEISLEHGVHGDRWEHAPHKSIEAQVTLMNSRAVELIAQSADRWALAGDQLYVDFDLSEDNVPAGTLLAVGSVVLEASAKDHTGCAKFSAYFGADAFKFVNSPEGARLNLRGINAKVIKAGVVHVGDTLRKI
jgi:MOSC domain-containing protein YiiM